MDSVQSKASSSASTVPSSRGTSHFISQTEIEMESAKARHWSELDYPMTDSELTAESNMKYFALLKEDPQWGRFFTDFEALEVGEEISRGAQAEIYEARNTRDGPFDLVVKVMKEGPALKAFQTQWPAGMLCARSKYKHLFDLPLITILGGTMLCDERFRGRFAFVMYRRWGDLRILIDRRMKQQRSTPGPFPIDQAIHLMSSIAGDMDVLHNKHDILHRDLKASNVLVWGQFAGDLSLIAVPNRAERIGSVVADFECSIGVVGTWFWMAPEIHEQLKARVPNSEVRLTRESDVYSYGMICYEIASGCTPYEGLNRTEARSQILQGHRPDLPHDLPEFVRNIIESCWHSDPLERPSFSAICMAFEVKRAPNPVCVSVDNESNSNASIVKIEKWNSCRAFTLLKVMQILMDMNLSISRAFDSSSKAMIMQYLEVVDCKGRKVVKYKSIAKIKKALSLPRSLQLTHEWECMSGSSEMSLYQNASPEMYVVEVITEWSEGLRRILSRPSGYSDFQVHSMKCGTGNGRLQYVIYGKGTRLFRLIWELWYYMVYPPIPVGRLRIMVQRVADEDTSYLEERLQSLKSMDLTRPCNPSNSSVHLKMSGWKGSSSIKVILCYEKGVLASNVFEYDKVFKDYSIVGASIKYPVRDEFLSKGKNSEDIDVSLLGKDESEKISRILGVAAERGCYGDNMELIISGSEGMVNSILTRIVYKNALVVNGGQVYCEIGTKRSSPSGDLIYFIS